MNNPIFVRYGNLLEPAIDCKLDEFKVLGYPTLQADDIWNYLYNKKWKRTPELAIYKVVKDIMSVKVGEILNYQTVEAFKSPNMLLNKEELEALLRD